MPLGEEVTRRTPEVERSRTWSGPGILLGVVLVSRRQVSGAIKALGICWCFSLGRHICCSADLLKLDMGNWG